MIAFLFSFVIWMPIPSNSQNGLRVLLNGNDVGQGDARLFIIVVFVLKSGQINVNVHLKNLEAVIRRSPKAHLLRDLLLDFVERIDWITKINVKVEPSSL